MLSFKVWSWRDAMSGEKSVSDFYRATPAQMKELVCSYSDVSETDRFWIANYIKDESHGIAHGRETSDAVLNLVGNLTREEEGKLEKEGRSIGEPYFETAVAVAQIGAYFHDCGRFASRGSINSGKDGLWNIELQNMHPDFGADRAASLIYSSGLVGALEAAPFLRESIASHEFQTDKLTPQYVPPATMIGKLVQAADQLRWLMPGAVLVTEKYNASRGVPLFLKDVSMEERLSWIANTPSRDALTVMLAQVCGPIGNKRFGTEYAQSEAKRLKADTRKSLIEFCDERGILPETIEIIREYERNCE